MNRNNWRARVPVLAVCLMLVSVLPAGAQQRNTLVIRDGVVRVNDSVVPPAELPSTLEVDGVDLSLSFSGIDQPVVRIGQHYYALTNGRLDELDADAYGQMTDDEDVLVPGESQWYRVGFADEMTRNQVRELEGRAAKIREMSEQLENRPEQEANQLAEEMKETAKVAAEMAAELPRVQAASYWDQVRATDRDLYDKLVREWQLESEVQRLARQVREMNFSGARTDKQIKQLRSLLEEAFELKQNNRRREIEQLEHQLKSLDNDLRKREDARQEIIEKRLQELIGQH